MADIAGPMMLLMTKENDVKTEPITMGDVSIILLVSFVITIIIVFIANWIIKDREDD